MRILQIFVAFFVFASVITTAEAVAEPPDQYVKIRLVPERSTIGPGEEIWIGVEQSIYPGWHTYWKNPGDSGAPPTIEWRLPEGFEISEIHWPAARKLPYGPLLNYGYENQVILLQKLKAPETLPGGPIELSADIELLVCKDECIPEYDIYDLTLNNPNNINKNNEVYIVRTLDKLPIKTNWSVEFYEQDGDFFLTSNDASKLAYCEQVDLLPAEWGVVLNPSDAEFNVMDGAFTLQQDRGERKLEAIPQISGVLTCTDIGGSTSYAFTASPRVISAWDPPAQATSNSPKLHLAQAILFAILGGLILNLMPCVFPVLSIKALSLVKIADEHPGLARMHGLSYTFGIVISFLAISGLLIFLQSTGAGIGWGFQLQDPVVVTLLAYLLFIIGLNLSGVFEFGGGLSNVGGKLTQGQGLSSSFFTGVLATIVAAPCTAPFMAGAIGYALTQPAIISLSVFAALGLGLALPYLLLSFIPALQAGLPKPGPWMVTFKELLAFPMYASSAWLVWILTQQAGPMGTFGVLLGMVAIAFGLWLLGHSPEKKLWRYKLKFLALVAFVFALGFLPIGDMPETLGQKTQSSFGETYSPEKLSQLLEEDDPIFVEMTAAWCITCKVNHATSINIDSTKALFAEKNVRYLVGDWTNQDEKITKYLNSFGRNGVPIYVYYGPRDLVTGERPEPQTLPQILTPAIVAEHVK